MSQAKDRTLFTITKAHYRNREVTTNNSHQIQIIREGLTQLRARRRGILIQRLNNINTISRRLRYFSVPNNIELSNDNTSSDEDILSSQDDIDLSFTPQISPNTENNWTSTQTNFSFPSFVNVNSGSNVNGTDESEFNEEEDELL